LKCWPDEILDQLFLWQAIAKELMTGSKLRKPGGINVNRGFPKEKEFSEQKKQFQDWLKQLANIEGLEEALAELLSLPDKPHFDDTQWQVLEAQLQLLLLANERLQQLFEQNGEADFIEIAMRALRALEDEYGRPTDLLLRLDYRIRHILVDEFQDTSMLQMRLLHNLTEGWQSGDGIHRTLFMVGDPMQSIYRFRKAEVGLFLLAAANKAGLPEVDSLNLMRNFRSSPVIVDWVNRAFASIFPDQPDILLAAVEHAAARAALEHDGKVCLHLQTEADASGEAEAIVATIREALGVAERRVAVLSRSRRHLHAIMQALTEAQIAYRAVDILPLHERPEIRLLRALLRALLHPADRESWAALLRAPCCGIDTRALHQLLASDDRPVIKILRDKERLAELDDNSRNRVSALLHALLPCIQSVGHSTVRPLLATAWQHLGMPGLIAQEANGNIEAMLGLVEEIDHGGQIDFATLDERLQKLYAAPNASPDASRIELLTMHGAKGLQWDVVILPGLGHGRSKSDSPLLAFTDVPVGEGIQPLVAVRGAVRNSDPVYDLVRSVEKVREKNELARLLYVACTRAETELHLFGHLPGEDATPSPGSLLSLLLPDGVNSSCFGIDPVAMQLQERETVHLQSSLTRIREIAKFTEALKTTEEENDNIDESEYFWAGAEAAPVGIAVHALLQQIGEAGIEKWESGVGNDPATIMKRILIGEGLSGSTLENALSRCLQTVERTVASKMGRWILSGKHTDVHNEWELWSESNGHSQQRFIDRSFIDKDGVRWIIDYKTSSHEGAELNSFLDSEEERYRPQLEGYRELLERMDGEQPIRTALYFPALDAWREISP
jgi:ATP-dependent exoDNAse (exonuclease V) beta subunit